jgi:hypothetical protein
VTEETNPRRPRRTARRAVTALAAAGVAALALSACQVQPGAAAFVGGDRISRAEVDKVTDALRRQAELNFGDVRQRTVGMLVMADLARRAASDAGVTAKAPDYASWAKANDLPTDNPFVRAAAEAEAYVIAMEQAADPTTPSEKDLQALFATLLQHREITPDYTVDSMHDVLDTKETGLALTVRAKLAAAARKYHVTVNPLYGDVYYYLAVPLAGGQLVGFLPVPLSSPAAGPVQTQSPAADTSTTGQ